MEKGDIIQMSKSELKRLHIIRQVIDYKLKQVDVIDILGLSDRQIRRIVKRVRKEGDSGIIHKLRGRVSSRAIANDIRDKVIRLYKRYYYDFGPVLASEKLLERDNIRISDETLRNWLIESGEWRLKRKARKHRQWRERKHMFGEMIQIDGSHHDWFEGRGAKCVLMGYIDDATNNVFAEFYEDEGTMAAMKSFKGYIKQYGVPNSIYIDRLSTYKSTAKRSIEDELNNRDPMSHFQKALKELGVMVIYAGSAPAKGRIERLFRTFQDRLIKEMRLLGISNIEDANKFLEHYLPIHNKRFGKKAIELQNLHTPIPQDIDLDSILCKKTERFLRNDFTIAHDSKLYQILVPVSAKKVIVEERMNGRMFVTYKNRYLRYKMIVQRPVKENVPQIPRVPKKPYIPPADHPWKNFSINSSYKQLVKEAVLVP